MVDDLEKKGLKFLSFKVVCFIYWLFGLGSVIEFILFKCKKRVIVFNF